MDERELDPEEADARLIDELRARGLQPVERR